VTSPTSVTECSEAWQQLKRDHFLKEFAATFAEKKGLRFRRHQLYKLAGNCEIYQI